ncbi:head GIN domain-containing protein [Chloroflexota bacterium]
MKKVIAAVMGVLILVSGLSAGCAGVKVQGSGNMINANLNISDFTKIKVENGFQVEVTEADSFKVTAIVDDNVLEHIDIFKSGDTLILRPKRSRSFRSATLSARVSMPDIEKIELSNGAQADIDNFDLSNDLPVTLSGGSQLKGSLSAGDLNLSLSDGSQVTLSGSVENLVIRKGSSGSHFNLENLSARNADISLSDGSIATINVDGTLNVDIRNGSKVVYIGQPKMGDIEVDWESDLIEK